MTQLTTASRLPPQRYLEHLGIESERFATALADVDPTARVPTCPDWDAAGLLRHLTVVQHHWTEVVARRIAGPQVEPPPETADHEDAVAAFRTGADALVSALAPVDVDEPAWTWSDDRTVGFILRRQAHEALIHRLDAELTARRPIGATDPQLAADGVVELLAVMVGACPSWGRFTPGPERVLIEATDTGDTVTVALGRFVGTDTDGVAHDEDDLGVVDPVVDGVVDGDADGDADLVVSASAAELDSWLWRRSSTAPQLRGSHDVRDRLLGLLGGPLD